MRASAVGLLFMEKDVFDSNNCSGCGNAIVNGGGPAPDGNNGCDMDCKGALAETCGGPNRLDVYQYGSSTLLSTSSESIQPTSTSSSIQPSATSASTGKRGIAYSTGNLDGNATYANLFKDYNKVTWGYDWGYPSHGLDASFQLYVDPLSRISELDQRADKNRLFQRTDALGVA
jgi:hypothetical protein